MNEMEFQQNFPAGVQVPELLRQLLRFQNQSNDWYSGHFELVQWKFGDAVWLAGDREAAAQFIVIGSGPDGSLYALWLYPGRTVDNAPIVFFGSEGTDNGLLAGSLRDFLSLLAMGADELGFEVSWGKVRQAEPPAERLSAFRDWLNTSFAILAPPSPEAIVAAGRAAHPDFGAWIDDWFASRA